MSALRYAGAVTFEDNATLQPSERAAVAWQIYQHVAIPGDGSIDLASPSLPRPFAITTHDVFAFLGVCLTG